jgi:hypothetical protein
MAHLVVHRNRERQSNLNNPTAVPQIVTRYLNHDISDDDPKAESDDEDLAKKPKKPQLVGDVRIVNRAFTRLRIAEACNAYLGMIGLGISIIEREIRFTYGKKTNDTIRIVLLSINLLTTLLLLVSLYFSYKMQFNWMKARGFLTKHDNLINTGMHKYLIAELIICFIAPMPFIYDSTFEEENNNYDVKVMHWYNDLLLAWNFVRIYLVLR